MHTYVCRHDQRLDNDTTTAHPLAHDPTTPINVADAAERSAVCASAVPLHSGPALGSLITDQSIDFAT